MSTPSGVEAVLFAELTAETGVPLTTGAIDAWVARVAADLLSSPVQRLLFRSGRVDAVYGLATADGTQVLLKVHRPPVDHDGLAATGVALEHLAANGYPCPRPLAGPVDVDGRTVTVQTLLTAGTADPGGSPQVRRAIASGLAEHVGLLRTVPGGVAALGSDLSGRPAWSDYASGPWPVPHDAVFDFTATPPGWEWLDDVARAASEDLLRMAGASDRVLGHADWYAGNLPSRVVAWWPPSFGTSCSRTRACSPGCPRAPSALRPRRPRRRWRRSWTTTTTCARCAAPHASRPAPQPGGCRRSTPARPGVPGRGAHAGVGSAAAAAGS